jgi:hypothetical protein
VIRSLQGIRRSATDSLQRALWHGCCHRTRVDLRYERHIRRPDPGTHRPPPARLGDSRPGRGTRGDGREATSAPGPRFAAPRWAPRVRGRGFPAHLAAAGAGCMPLCGARCAGFASRGSGPVGSDRCARARRAHRSRWFVAAASRGHRPPRGGSACDRRSPPASDPCNEPDPHRGGSRRRCARPRAGGGRTGALSQDLQRARPAAIRR